MKILHVSFSSSGGAGEVASTLNSALSELGQVSEHLYLTKSNLHSEPLANPDATFLAAIDHYLVKKRGFRSQVSLYRGMPTKAGIQDFALEFDILHLHWPIGLLSRHEVMKLQTRLPVIWTMHDYWGLTGGCHFPGACSAWATGCKKCPAVRPLFRRAVRSQSDDLRGAKNIHFVFPTQFAQSKAEKNNSGFLNGHVIPNPVITFRTSSSTESNEFNSKFLSTGQLSVGLMAANLSDPRKRILDFFETFANLEKNKNTEADTPKPVFHLAGNPFGLPPLGVESRIFGTLKDSEIGEFLRGLDLIIIPSTEETFSLVCAQALIQKVPVWTLANTPQAELVSKYNGGRIFETLPELASAILNATNQSRLSTEVAEQIKKDTNPIRVAKQYMEIYELARENFTF